MEPLDWIQVKPIEGNVDLFMKLIEALCNDDKECIEYLLNYLAHMVQKALGIATKSHRHERGTAVSVKVPSWQPLKN